MVYTVTFNPSIDYIMNVDSIILGNTNRSNFEDLYPGGKGINVSIVLSNLGIKNKAIAFSSGFTGEYIKERLKKVGCDCDFIDLKQGFSRINVKVRGSIETEINAQGPIITDENIKELMTKIKMINDEDTLVLSGSIPNCLPQGIYRDIIANVNSKIKIIVDATNELLLNVLEYKPFLIKPNLQELSELFNVTIETDEEIIHYAKELIKQGAQNVLVSNGGKNAILVSSNDKIYIKQPPKGKLVNSVGAGDSMVAGFIAGYEVNQDLYEAFNLAIYAGSATAYKAWLANKQDVEELQWRT